MHLHVFMRRCLRVCVPMSMRHCRDYAHAAPPPSLMLRRTCQDAIGTNVIVIVGTNINVNRAT